MLLFSQTVGFTYQQATLQESETVITTFTDQSCSELYTRPIFRVSDIIENSMENLTQKYGQRPYVSTIRYVIYTF
jgi:hypothetical protein